MLAIKSCIPEQVEVTVTNQESKPSIHFPLGGDKLMVSRNEVMVENGLFVLASRLERCHEPRTAFNMVLFCSNLAFLLAFFFFLNVRKYFLFPQWQFKHKEKSTF